MNTIAYKTRGTCSSMINIEIDDNDIICSVTFVGGCSGNTKGVAALIRGMAVNEAIDRLDGIKCGYKSTSCPDQLAQALKSYVEGKSE